MSTVIETGPIRPDYPEPLWIQAANLITSEITSGVLKPGMRLPTAVATDGRNLAVADTANNRVLLWKSIPTQIGQPADIVVGQPDFVTISPVVVNQTSLRGPQGVLFGRNVPSA